MTRWTLGLAVLVAILSTTLARGAAPVNVQEPAGAGREAPWPAAVPGFVPVKGDEHPRLFFRKSDLAALRDRAQTPEGRAIVARLKVLLGGGDDMPASYNPAKQGYSGVDGSKLPLGTYTLWHGAGFGMLYQLTDDRKYAELGRQCVEKAREGVRDIDDRNAWLTPSSTMRGGPSLAAIAVAYDLCHDGWDAAYREKLAGEIIHYERIGDKKGSGHLKSSLREYCLKPNMPPRSNHFGMKVGGAALAVLAVMGDSGCDDTLVKQYLPGLEKNLLLAVTEGFGDGGYFYEHPGPGNIGLGQTLTPAFQAMKVALGKDYITPRTNVRWLTMKWAMEIVPDGKGRCFYPNGWPQGGYGTELFDRGGNSHGGQFAQGFGAVSDGDKPALLWVYKTFVEPKEDQGYAKFLKPGEKSYDAMLYPHRAVLAFVNWPFGVEPKNPAENMPKVAADSIWGHHVFRNRWRDADDCVTAVTLGARGGPRSNRCMVWGLKDRLALGNLPNCKTTYFQPAEDGSGVVSGEGGHFIGVDYSRVSGAEALVVMVGPTAGANRITGRSAKLHNVTAGTRTYSIVTLSHEGRHPEAKIEGDKVVLGGQTITCDEEKIVFGKMAGPPRSKP